MKYDIIWSFYTDSRSEKKVRSPKSDVPLHFGRRSFESKFAGNSYVYVPTSELPFQNFHIRVALRFNYGTGERIRSIFTKCIYEVGCNHTAHSTYCTGYHIRTTHRIC
jgi:hypothetical protein